MSPLRRLRRQRISVRSFLQKSRAECSHGPPQRVALSSSPVQDVALSRRKQGFKSP